MFFKIYNEKFESRLIGEDIFHITYFKDCTSTLDDLQKGYTSYLKLSNGKPMKALIELKENAYFDIEVDECIKKGPVQPIVEAIVTNSLAVRLMIDYYVNARRNNYQIRLFSTKALALEWLKSI